MDEDLVEEEKVSALEDAVGGEAEVVEEVLEVKRDRANLKRRRELKRRVAAVSGGAADQALDLSGLGMHALPGRALRLYAKVTALDVSDNAMRGELPKELTAFTRLRRIIARDNALTALPDRDGGVESLQHWEVMDFRLSNLTELEVIDLSGNAFTNLPIAAAAAPVLRTLNLSRNCIGPVLDEAAMAALTSLHTLDLSDNKLEEVPNSALAMAGLVGLRELRLGGNSLALLPAKLGKLAELTVLDVRGNQLTELPKDERTGMPSLGKLLLLEHADFGDNALTEVGDEVGDCVELTYLSVEGNAIAALPNKLGALLKLTTLRAGRNALATLPDALGALRALTALDVATNKLTALPDALGQLRGLTSLGLASNQLAEVPDSITALVSLTELSLQHNVLAALPEGLGALTALVKLELHHNQLEGLPASIGTLVGLTRLNLEHNALAGLPDSIGALSGLTDLNLGNNTLKGLPDSIGALSALRALSLVSNSLRKLPKSIAALGHLAALDLSYNKLADEKSNLAALGQLKGLAVLSLSNNRLTTLPDACDALIELRGVDLSANNMKAVPLPIVRLANRRGAALQHCKMDGNPCGRVEDAALRDLLRAVSGNGQTRAAVEEKRTEPMSKKKKKKAAAAAAAAAATAEAEAKAEVAPHPLAEFAGSTAAHAAAARKLSALGGAELFEALKQLTLAVEASPSTAAGRLAAGRLLFERAVLHLRVQNAAPALDDCNGAIARGFVSPAVYVCRARAEQRLERLTDAIASCSEAIVAKPTFSVAHCLRATLYLAIGRNIEAQKDAEFVLLHAPENVTARFTLGRALLKLHLPQQAADEFAKVAESVTAKGGECGGLPHYYRAVAVLECSGPRAAIDAFSHAIREEQKRDTAADVRLLCDAFTGRSAVLLEAGNTTRSARDFESSAKLKAHLDSAREVTTTPTTLQKLLRRLK